MAKLPDLTRYGMTWQEPPAHVVPELSMVDKLHILVQAAGHAAKTHCKRGHPMRGDNVWF